jgi:hypothetical protein
MPCVVCGLPDSYHGQGDGIGSCDCARCDCGAASGSDFCVCPDDDWDRWGDLDDDDSDDEWEPVRRTEDVPTRGLL